MTKPRKPVEPTPVHGIGAESIDFDRYYAWVDSLTVTLPDMDPADAPDLRTIAMLLAKVQNRRSDAERVAALLERKIGECKRQSVILIEGRRLERAEYLSNQAYRGLPAIHRDAIVESGTGKTTALIASAAARKAELDAALRVIRSQIDSLEMAKQTLNAISRIGESERPINPYNRR